MDEKTKTYKTDRIDTVRFDFLDDDSFVMSINGHSFTENYLIPVGELRKLARTLSRIAVQTWTFVDEMMAKGDAGFEERENATENKAQGDSPAKCIIEKTRHIILKDAGFSKRVWNALLSYDIVTLEQLLRCRRVFLSRLQGIGRMSLNEIDYYMEKTGFVLGSLSPIWIAKGLTAYNTGTNKAKNFASYGECKEWVATENNKILVEEQ